MPQTHTAVIPTLKLNGATLSASEAKLVHMRVHRTLHAAGTASLAFRTDSLAGLTSGDFDLGGEVEVFLPKGASALKSVFKGEIVSLGFDTIGGAQQSMTLKVEVRDGSHRLGSGSQFLAYLDQKRSAVASTIAGRHGLSFEGDSSDVSVPYLLQTGSDHAMLTQMAQEIGWEWFTDAGKLYFRKRGTTAPVTLSPSDDTLLQFSVMYTGTPVAKSLEMYAWSPGAAPVSGAGGSVISSPTAAHLGSSARFVDRQYGKAKTAFGQDYLIANQPTTASDATAQAEAAAARLVGGGLHAQGQCEANADLAPGQLITIENLTGSVDGTYYLTSVTHDFAPRIGVRTSFESGGHKVEPAPDEAGDGLAAWGRLGLAVGKVSNLNDPENFGRVKVKFAALGDSGESDWAWVVAPGAGPSRGIDFRPEINDEVVVGFESGNPRQAFVLGGLWTGTDLPDTTAVEDGKVVKRVISSRSGHKIVLIDNDTATSAESAIQVLHVDGKTKLDLTGDGVTLETADDKQLTIKAGGSEIVFGTNGALTIKASTLKIEAEQTVNVEAKGGDLGLKGVNAKLESSANAEVKAGAMGKFEAGGILTVKGSLVKVN